MDFKAEPSSIKPGESTTLTWAVENPRTTTIEPTFGRATARGVLKVTPAATTTYTLTVTGVNGTLTRTVTVKPMFDVTAIALPLGPNEAGELADPDGGATTLNGWF